MGFLLCSVAACKGQDAHAEFVYAASADVPEITYLVAVVGNDKAHRPSIRPGDRFEMDFRADGGGPRIDVNYSVGGKEFGWVGPEIPAGQRYDIEIQIAADQSVMSRYCVRPCELARVKLAKAQPATQMWPRQDGGAPAE
jgi:hypothetical protein